ncbi:response regulator [Halostagnicola larsenii]|uniref:response regulator n=1 Tax=Halostagnicola larsenii TaxID=353800 RepID=UPI00067935EC|nr:response regulator [Halostagnicola larsenii]
MLHVDDDEALVDLAATLLERECDPLEVVTETSVDAALQVLRAQTVDCVISDYDMPGQDGLAFLERVRTTAPNLPFILFTGYDSAALKADAIQAGVTEYQRKRTDTEQYAVLAERVLEAVES